jgi:hypothetical protein
MSASRRHRLHHQRRGPRHGDDGHDQAGRGASPRTSSTSAAAPARSGWSRPSAPCCRTAMSRSSSSTSSPASTAATGWPKGWCRPTASLGLTLPVVVRLAGTNVEEGRAIIAVGPAAHLRRHAGRGRRQGRRRAPPPKPPEEETHGHPDHRDHPRHRPGHDRPHRQFHAADMIRHGTNVVGGVTPGRGGETHLDRPLFNTVREAVRGDGRRGIPRLRAAPLRRRRDHGSRRCRHQDRRLRDRRHPVAGHDEGQALPAPLPEERKMRLIGPNCAGIISPARASWASCRRISTCPAASASSAARARWAMRPRPR